METRKFILLEDLFKPIQTFERSVWIEYKDPWDHYKFKVEKTNWGFSVMVTLNKTIDYTQRAIFYTWGTQLAVILAHSAKLSIDHYKEHFENAAKLKEKRIQND